MVTRSDLVPWVRGAIIAHGGSATISEVAKHIWDNHENELRRSGNLFYTWQYDMRWAALKLRKSGQLKSASVCEKGVWELSE